MRTNMWKEGFNQLPPSNAKDFAMILEERLRHHMARLRLGGNDPLIVSQRSLREAIQSLPQSKSKNPNVLHHLAVVVLVGLRLLKRYHSYGEYINVERLLARLSNAENEHFFPLRIIPGAIPSIEIVVPPAV